MGFNSAFKGLKGYAGDWCQPRIPCSFAAHGIL